MEKDRIFYEKNEMEVFALLYVWLVVIIINSRIV